MHFCFFRANQKETYENLAGLYAIFEFWNISLKQIFVVDIKLGIDLLMHFGWKVAPKMTPNHDRGRYVLTPF